MKDTQLLWKLETIAHKADRLTTAIITEAARLENRGKGLAMVADELRILSTILYDTVEEGRFGSNTTTEEVLDKVKLLAPRAELLGINASLESVKQQHTAKGALICAEEIRQIAHQMKELITQANSGEDEKPIIDGFSSVQNTVHYFLGFNIGGFDFIENCQFIQEVLYYPGVKRAKMLQDNYLNLRGEQVPFVGPIETLGFILPENEEQLRVLVIRLPHSSPTKYLAVLITGFSDYGIFTSKLGKPVAEVPPIIHPDMIRECWRSTDGKLLPFLNWDQLAKLG